MDMARAEIMRLRDAVVELQETWLAFARESRPFLPKYLQERIPTVGDVAVPFEAPGKLAGYRRHRAHPATIAVVVDAAEAGLDTEGGRLAVQCLLHSEIINTDHIDVANDLIKDPTEFCEYCRQAARPAGGVLAE